MASITDVSAAEPNRNNWTHSVLKAWKSARWLHRRVLYKLETVGTRWGRRWPMTYEQHNHTQLAKVASDLTLIERIKCADGNWTNTKERESRCHGNGTWTTQNAGITTTETSGQASVHQDDLRGAPVSAHNKKYDLWYYIITPYYRRDISKTKASIMSNMPFTRHP